ncbi:hypothetical protein M427DRAFT_118554 [Gonapodya prolifera JEL478]|uniref:Amino acid transporter transmembrane domain-containing protein n=1 Tax=Gonapodya prolifera (strain JEL478) TaxID=1344416 RepID=A0A139AXL7_GONPJ|nr:hypothetical protein M427DRAFT_118554 [Gonapodya prolifera JEL478]|eukprot:KXS21486.1 hypothetical protein M427DRAFT_118554 [Gonapodya prolifera JEL478]
MRDPKKPPDTPSSPQRLPAVARMGSQASVAPLSPLPRKELMRSTTNENWGGLDRRDTVAGPATGDNQVRFVQLKRTDSWSAMLRVKTVGILGSFSLMTNNMLGPGLVSIPVLYQKAGWLLPTLALLIYTPLSVLSSLFIVEAMQTIPGNRRFKGVVEFSTLLNFFFGKKTHLFGQFILYLALQLTNVSSIVISAQTMDNLVIAIAGRTCGVAVGTGGWNAANATMSGSGATSVLGICATQSTGTSSPFGSTFMLFTIGLIVTVVMIIPLGMIKLADNIFAQFISTLLTIVIFVIWVATFGLVLGDPTLEENSSLPSVPTVTSDFQALSMVVGTILFNLAFVTTVPSWVNVRSPRVDIPSTLWWSSIYSSVLYVILGVLGAATLPLSFDGNLLSAINAFVAAADVSVHFRRWLYVARATVYAFPLVTLVTSIPIFIIIVHENLVQNNVCGKRLATFLSSIVPFLVAIPFQTGGSLNTFVSWSSLFTTSLANFVFPIIIYLRSQRFREEWRQKKQACLTDHQKELLAQIHPESQAVKKHLERKALKAAGDAGAAGRNPAPPSTHTAGAIAILSSAIDSFTGRFGLGGFWNSSEHNTRTTLQDSFGSGSSILRPGSPEKSFVGYDRAKIKRENSSALSLSTSEDKVQVPTFIVTSDDAEQNELPSVPPSASFSLPPTPQIRPTMYGSHLKPDLKLLRQPSARSTSDQSPPMRPTMTRSPSSLLSVQAPEGVSLRSLSLDTGVLEVPGTTATLTLDGVELEVNDPLADGDDFDGDNIEVETDEESAPGNSRIILTAPTSSGRLTLERIGLRPLSRNASGVSYDSFRSDKGVRRSQMHKSKKPSDGALPENLSKIEDSTLNRVYRSATDTAGFMSIQLPMRSAPTIMDEKEEPQGQSITRQLMDIANPIAITRTISRNIQLELDGARVFSATGGSLFGINRTSIKKRRPSDYFGNHGSLTMDTHSGSESGYAPSLDRTPSSVSRSDGQSSYFDMTPGANDGATTPNMPISVTGRKRRSQSPIHALQTRMGSLVSRSSKEARKSMLGLLEEEPERGGERYDDGMPSILPTPSSIIATPTLSTPKVPVLVIHPATPAPERVAAGAQPSDDTGAPGRETLQPRPLSLVEPSSPTSSINSSAASDTISYDRKPPFAATDADQPEFPSLQRSMIAPEDVNWDPPSRRNPHTSTLRTLNPPVVVETFNSSNFRTVPDWFPVSERVAAIACLSVLAVTLVFVIGLNFYNAARVSSTSS